MCKKIKKYIIILILYISFNLFAENEFRNALVKNDLETIRILINKDKKLLNAPVILKKKYLTPIQFAAAKKNIILAQMLIKMGANVNSTTKTSPSPLFIALKQGDTRFLKFLLKHGVKENIFTVCALGNTKKLENYIKDDASSVNAKSNSINLLGVTTIFNQYECAEFLLNNDADINAYPFYSPALLAILYNRPNFFNLFIKNGLNLSKKGKNLLKLAKLYNRKKIITILLQNKVKPRGSKSTIDLLHRINETEKE